MFQDLIRVSEDRAIDFAVRISLLIPSTSIQSNLPPGTSCLSAVTYQLWVRRDNPFGGSNTGISSGGGGAAAGCNAVVGQRVMVGELRCGDPDSLVAAILRHATVMFGSQGVGEVFAGQRDLLPAELVHYTRHLLSASADSESSDLTVVYGRRISAGSKKGPRQVVDSVDLSDAVLAGDDVNSADDTHRRHRSIPKGLSRYGLDLS